MTTRSALTPVAVSLALLLAACAKHNPPPSLPQPAAPFRVVATLQDLMDSEVDPSADAVWDAFGSVLDAGGWHDLHPQSDAEWKEVRRHATTLIEAANLLIMEGRKIAAKDFPADAAGGSLSSQEIATKIAASRESFVQYARLLQETGIKTLAAIDARNVSAVLESGAQLDSVCEACHTVFWYPNQATK